MTAHPARWRCHAKVNLTLEVIGRRDDGYHDLASLMHTVELADELDVEPAPSLEVIHTGEHVDPDADLVRAAARLLASTTGTELGARLTLAKHIPVAAGLAGGSSDAATTLRALAWLWTVRLGDEELARLALRLGSDVPYLLQGGLAVVRGRGERVEPLATPLDQWLVLLVPTHQLAGKTARLFAALRPDELSNGARTADLAQRLATTPRVGDSDLVNGFAAAARRSFAGLDELWRRAEQLAERPFHLSGAGPALFALAADGADARQASARLASLGQRVFATSFVQPSRTRDRYASARPIRYA